MTNLVSIKSISEVALHGVKVDWTKEDKNIKEIRFRDSNGGHVVIRAGTYGDVLKIMIPQPYEEADRYLLSGKLLGLTEVREYFEDKYAAENKLSEYADQIRGEHGLTVAKVKVKIDEAGEVAETAASNPSTEDDIAF